MTSAEEMPRINPPGKVYTINIRRGVQFHNGREVTAADARLPDDILYPQEEAVSGGAPVMETDLSEKLAAYFRQRADARIAGAYLFGSRRRGVAARESDIDVGVALDPASLTDANARFDFRIELIGDLVHALGENEVDVMVLNEVPAPVAAKVIQEGLCVFAPQPERLRTFERDVQLRAGDLQPFLQRSRRAQLERLR